MASRGQLLNNYANILELLLRLRQACDHPYLTLQSKAGPVQGAETRPAAGATWHARRVVCGGGREGKVSLPHFTVSGAAEKGSSRVFSDIDTLIAKFVADSQAV
jgi:SNF2 family DNA or RNA helicase